MKSWLFRLVLCVLLLAGLASAAQAQDSRLKRIYFNLYTDSLKPILNYYVNIEGEYEGGRFLPLDTAVVRLRASVGQMRGNEWVIPPVINFDRVRFDAESREKPWLRDSVVIYLQKYQDPRDAPDYEEPEGARQGRRR